ncbi:MAG: hypothetical protein Q7R52_00205 [archaeon]|nr:hypothetical protein [archaeon]
MTDPMVYIGTDEVLEELKQISYKVLRELPKDTHQAAAALAWIVKLFEQESGIDLKTVKVWTE